MGNQFSYDGVPGTHQWYDGTPHPWEFKRVWHIEPSLASPDLVYAGVEDAALFHSFDGGMSWRELSGLRQHGTGPAWQPGAGGMCLHSILLDPANPSRMFIAISAAGAFRTDNGGESWRPINQGLHSAHIPDPAAEVGHCVHHLAMHPSRPDNAVHAEALGRDAVGRPGDAWHEISGNLPSDFGFVIDVHAHEPETLYVVPIKSDAEHFPIDGQLRVYRSRSGGNDWEPLTNGLPQSNCYVNVLRDAMAVDSLDSLRRLFWHDRRAGLCLRRCGRHVAADRARSSAGAVRRGADIAMRATIRVELPSSLSALAGVPREVAICLDGPATQRSLLDALEANYPVLRGTIRDHANKRRRAFVRFFACEEDLSHCSPNSPLPTPVVDGREAFMVVGAIAGG